MKTRLLGAIFTLALLLLSAGRAMAQQTNMHLSVPPIVDSEVRKSTSVSGSYIRMDGDGIDLSGLDVSMTFRTAIGEDGASDVTVGAALLGSLLGGEMALGANKRDASGVVLHATYNREYFVMQRPASSLMLFWGIPASFGHYIIEDAVEVTLYNLMAGVQGGARLGLTTGRLLASPLLMATFMGGYRERYDGGVYYANLDSGGVPVFAVLTAGLEVLYLPRNLSLRGTYQRTLKSGDNRPMNTATVQIGWRF